MTVEPEPEVTEPRSLGSAIDVLDRAIHVNHLVFMAGEMLGDDDSGNAIAIGVDVTADLLKQVRAIVYAHVRRQQSVAS
jgi:hypothetical protein